MEIQQHRPRTFVPAAVVAGSALILLGIALLLDATGTTAIRPGRFIAPLILIGIGASIVLDRGRCKGARDGERQRGRPAGGLWLIGIGCWMLVSQTHLFGLSYGTSWPLLVVFMGMLMVMRGMR
jgi:hypothetical protein